MKTIKRKATNFKTGLILSVIVVLLLGACNKHVVANKSPKQYYYTCSIHPEVFEMSPGKCPKCGMALEQQNLEDYSKNNSYHGGHSHQSGQRGGCH